MAFTFPDPNVTTEFTGDNGITYSWDAVDGKWQIKRYAADFDDRYVNEDGDIMTGSLLMDDASIAIDNGEITLTQSGIAAELDASFDKAHEDPRFSTIRSTPPYQTHPCLLYTSPSPRDRTRSRMPSSA